MPFELDARVAQVALMGMALGARGALAQQPLMFLVQLVGLPFELQVLGVKGGSLAILCHENLARSMHGDIYLLHQHDHAAAAFSGSHVGE